MHASWINLVADVAELLAGGLAFLYYRNGLSRDRAVRAPWQELVRRYPGPDRELDMIWQGYRR
jgi:hypothetical protein